MVQQSGRGWFNEWPRPGSGCSKKPWRSELREDTSDPEAHDDLRPLFVNGFHPDRSPDLTLQFEPFFVRDRAHCGRDPYPRPPGLRRIVMSYR